MAGIGSGFATALKIGTAAVGSLKSISGVSVSADTIETTTMDSADGYKTFIQGLKDGGEVSVNGLLDTSDADGQIALLAAFNTGASTAFTIVFPTAIGFTWTFNAIVTGVSTNADMEDAATFEATLKVTGKPALAATS